MSIYLLNCSVDSSDLLLDQKVANYNHQESVIEIFIEQILSYEGIIGEVEDGDVDTESILKKVTSLDFFVIPKLNCVNRKDIFFDKKKHSLFQNPHELSPLLKIESPPPKV